MARNDLYRSDASERERRVLNTALSSPAQRAQPAVPVSEALRGDAIYKSASVRDIVRVLFISRDETLLNPTRQTLDGFIELSDLFDEVHILILREGIKARHPVLRVAENVWLYTASSRVWWWTPSIGMRLIREQLEFVGGLRPDLIVARDPFESALVAHLAARHYNRPSQLHVLEDYTRTEFVTARAGNRWRRLLARFLLPRFASVRAGSVGIETQLGKRFLIDDLTVLPRYCEYDALLSLSTDRHVRAVYPAFSFIMLYIGRLDHECTLHQVLEGAALLLQNPQIGLLVLGSGPAQKEFERRATVLGIRAQVVFLNVPEEEEAMYLAIAHVLVVSDTDSNGDAVALKGAAAGVPLLLSRNDYRDDLFVHMGSALLFRHDTVEEFRVYLNRVLNDVSLRRTMVYAARALIHERFNCDQVAYRTSYRSCVEEALFVSSEGKLTK